MEYIDIFKKKPIKDGPSVTLDNSPEIGTTLDITIHPGLN